MKKYLGIIEALISATLFGLIPFFFIPLHQNNFNLEPSLSYRFIFATLIMLVMALYSKKSLYIKLPHFLFIALIGFIYFIATVLLFSALTIMPSGIVTTIFFTNPIFVMIIMVFVYKEKLELYKIILSLITCFGVALLSGFFSEMSQINFIGLSYSALSGIAYAIYIIGLYKIQTFNLSKESISIYIFLTCAVSATIYSLYHNSFQIPSGLFDWYNLFMLALVPAVLANILLISCIKKIGSVLASILGAMEPITAVLVGVLVFNEAINISIVTGMLIVVVSVILITIIPNLRAGKKAESST